MPELIFSIFRAKIRKGTSTSMYFAMRLFLVEQMPWMNVRLYDGSVDKGALEEKQKAFRNRIFKVIGRMEKLLVGNSRLFVRMQMPNTSWHDMALILQLRKGDCQHENSK